jgi:hypothetical protein
MNESLDLRKRILKMREENNIVLDNIQFKEVVQDKVTIDHKKNKLEEFQEEKKIINSSLFKKESSNYKKTKSDLSGKNEAQFRILANKFNEAVEVILELSEKVQKLERNVYKENFKLKKENKLPRFLNFKILFIFIILSLLISWVYTLSFETSIMKKIFFDILKSI